jgi:quercetin dioxygenase-like cupin family protein
LGEPLPQAALVKGRGIDDQELRYPAGAEVVVADPSARGRDRWSRRAPVYGGHEKVLRQTLVAMVGGAELSEHENPGEATVLGWQGRVRLSSGELAWGAAAAI